MLTLQELHELSLLTDTGITKCGFDPGTVRTQIRRRATALENFLKAKTAHRSKPALVGAS